jgi:hypothetical protein
MDPSKRRKTIEIDRGLFLVRYATAEDEAAPPKVTVEPESAIDHSINFFLHPDQETRTLWNPGSCLVVRAATRTRLVVEVEPLPDSRSAAASVRVEPLTQGRAPPELSPEQRWAGQPFDLHDIVVLGHIAGIGDVRVQPHEWLAGPSAPSRIEGIAIEWPSKPADVEIRYVVTTSKPEPISGRARELGSYAGTRGKALAVVGLELEIDGSAASRLKFEVEAIFLGAPATRASGQRVVLSGPTGREPLVGLRLGLQEVLQGQRVTPHVSKPQSPSNRVRVFRGRARQDQSVAS